MRDFRIRPRRFVGDLAGAALKRLADRAICERANLEMEARFMPLTGENAAEAIRWQEHRIEELRGQA